MPSRESIVALDKAHVWHPYTAMAPYVREADPLVIARAEGVYLYDANGTRYFDGNSSWWVSSLGHRHPRLVKALVEQASTLDHCALAGIAHEQSATLAKELIDVAPKGLSRVFYTDNGSGSIEVALQIAVDFHKYEGRPEKRRIVALGGAFHGDTLGAKLVGGLSVFQTAFGTHAVDVVRVPFPEPQAFDHAFHAVSQLIETESDQIAAVIVEPLLQGAAGMRVYSPDYLRHLRELCDKHDVLLIADEVFTGYGRAGTMWACDQAKIAPDLMCLGKTFASILPMAATLAAERVFEPFLKQDDRALYYGHTFCGNPLGARVAREVLAIFREEKIVEHVASVSESITARFQSLGSLPGVLRWRSLGMVGAIDLKPTHSTAYLGTSGWRVYDEAKKRGVYLRPLGDTVYVTPPLVATSEELRELLDVVEESVRAILS